MQKKMKMTAAKVRYLTVLAQLDQDGRGIRSVALARKLGVSRPSVHAMITKLSDEGLVEKERYGIVYLTEEGDKKGRKYNALYQEITEKMKTSEIDPDAVYSMISAYSAQNQ